MAGLAAQCTAYTKYRIHEMCVFMLNACMVLLERIRDLYVCRPLKCAHAAAVLKFYAT
jgi:hypothetical protein